MGNPVVHFEVVGKDAKSLQNFYKQAFDWQIDPPGQGAGAQSYAIVHPQKGVGIDGGIGDMGGMDGYSGHVTFYVGVPDINAALSKVETLGGKRVMGPQQVPGGPTIALFNDPEGHVIGLVETPA
jgi:predicted enzyme related to lactoylglutathione lyase